MTGRGDGRSTTLSRRLGRAGFDRFRPGHQPVSGFIVGPAADGLAVNIWWRAARPVPGAFTNVPAVRTPEQQAEVTECEAAFTEYTKVLRDYGYTVHQARLGSLPALIVLRPEWV